MSYEYDKLIAIKNTEVAKCVEEKRSAGINILRGRKSFEPACRAAVDAFYADQLAQVEGSHIADIQQTEQAFYSSMGLSRQTLGILALIIISAIAAITLLKK